MSFSDIIDAGFMDVIYDSAIDVIKAERATFNNVFYTIENYCQEAKLIISNKYVLMDEADDLKNIYQKKYEIYTCNPLRHANNLVNKIYKNTSKSNNAKYTRLKTIKENEEFIIDYDFRQVATIFKIQKHKKGEPYDIIRPIKINSILYFPSEIELIDIYHTLYNPVNFCDRDESHEIEKKLFNQVVKRKTQGILGAGKCKLKKKGLIEAVKVGIIKEWLPNRNDFVLIGPWVRDWYKLGKNICTNHDKIQLIGKMNHNELLDNLQKYIKTFTKFKLSVREQLLDIPKDFRIKRYTYYIHVQLEKGIVQKPFLDLFNCMEFEIIPAVKNSGILLGTKWVILRFLFIDIWILHVIKSLGLLSDNILNKKIDQLWNVVTFFKGDDYKYKEKDVGFYGIYRDYSMDKKNANIKGKRFYPYYPYLYNIQHNNYRNI